MSVVAPLGGVYQAGTLSGNPIAMTAGLATLDEIAQPGFYDRLNQTAVNLTDGLEEIAKSSGIPFTTNQVGGMFGMFFSTEENISSFDQVMQCDSQRFRKFFHGMLSNGVNFAPSPFETAFVSSAHAEAEIKATLDAAETVFKQI